MARETPCNWWSKATVIPCSFLLHQAHKLYIFALGRSEVANNSLGCFKISTQLLVRREMRRNVGWTASEKSTGRNSILPTICHPGCFQSLHNTAYLNPQGPILNWAVLTILQHRPPHKKENRSNQWSCVECGSCWIGSTLMQCMHLGQHRYIAHVGVKYLFIYSLSCSSVLQIKCYGLNR